MDKTGIIVVSICVVLLGWWFVEQNKIAKQQALYALTNQVAQAQSPAAGAPAGPSAAPAPQAPVTVPVAFNTNLPEQTLTLTNASARYTFTSRGGGLKLVELLAYPQTISARWKTSGADQTNGVATLNSFASVPALAVLGDPGLVGDGNFALTRTAGGIRAEKVLTNGLRVVKDFELSSNYLVQAHVWLANTTPNPLALPAQEFVVGTATPMDADDNGQAEGVMWSDGSKAADQALSGFLGGGCVFMRSGPKSEIIAGHGNVAWVAAHNQFFALMAMPKDRAQEMVARPVVLPQFSDVKDANAALPRGVQAALVYPAQTLAANSSVERQVVLFAGPKEYRTLADIGAQFQNRADDVMGFGSLYGFCAKPLLLALNWLHDFTTLGYGWVIVLLTILLRAIFWPLTAASTRSMKRMQALAPEMAILKEKYKDDQQKYTQKQMELWKKHKVNPMSGCLPMLVQMPVFFGFFTMIRGAIELRGAHFFWATDLSKPDTLFMIPGLSFLPFATPEGLPFNLLPLLMGGAMLWQSHLTPASPGMDASQQKIMRYMPLMFLLFLYNYSAGMSLYMVVSTLASVLQTKMTKNLKDPAAPAGPAGPAVNPALTPLSKSKK